MSAQNPTATVFIREQRGQAFYEAFWRYGGKQLKRRLGPAWLDQGLPASGLARQGRVAEGFLDERRAHVAAAESSPHTSSRQTTRSAPSGNAAPTASPSARCARLPATRWRT